MIEHPPDPTIEGVNSAISMDFRDRFNERGMPPHDPPYTVPEFFITHDTADGGTGTVTRHVPKFDFDVTTLDGLMEYTHAVGYFARDHLYSLMHSCTMISDGMSGDIDQVDPDDLEEYINQGVPPGELDGQQMVCAQTMGRDGDMQSTYMPIVEQRGIAYCQQPLGKEAELNGMDHVVKAFWDGFLEAVSVRN